MRTIWAVALVGLGFSVGVRADDSFGPASVPPEAQSFHLGTLTLTALHDARYVVPNDTKTFGVDASAPAVSEVLHAAGAPTDRIVLSVNALLVRTGKRVVLLDSGLGAKNQGVVAKSLSQAGVAPDAVTDVLITHTHGDHIGGVLDADGHLAFPKATIRMTSAEWTWLQSKGPAELVKAISEHVKTFEPGAQIAPGIKAVALDGHTPGHTGYEITSGKSRLLDIGDLAHSTIISLAKPQWTMGFDNDATVGKATRQAELAKLATDQELVFAPHFPFPGVGYVVKAGDGFAWKADVPKQ